MSITLPVPIEQIVQQYISNEENNAHRENIVLLATNFGDDEDKSLANSFKEKFYSGEKLSPSEKNEYNLLEERLWKKPPVLFHDLYQGDEEALD